jgi:hypothetical protein
MRTPLLVFSLAGALAMPAAHAQSVAPEQAAPAKDAPATDAPLKAAPQAAAAPATPARPGAREAMSLGSNIADLVRAAAQAQAAARAKAQAQAAPQPAQTQVATGGKADTVAATAIP